jgi:hypothetical protein
VLPYLGIVVMTSFLIQTESKNQRGNNKRLINGSMDAQSEENERWKTEVDCKTKQKQGH